MGMKNSMGNANIRFSFNNEVKMATTENIAVVKTSNRINLIFSEDKFRSLMVSKIMGGRKTWARLTRDKTVCSKFEKLYAMAPNLLSMMKLMASSLLPN